MKNYFKSVAVTLTLTAVSFAADKAPKLNFKAEKFDSNFGIILHDKGNVVAVSCRAYSSQVTTEDGLETITIISKQGETEIQVVDARGVKIPGRTTAPVDAEIVRNFQNADGETCDKKGKPNTGAMEKLFRAVYNRLQDLKKTSQTAVATPQ